MFGRIFGRGKDDRDQAVCAECGRTLLAGEWTQTVVDDRGNERLICSLCGQAYAGAGEPVAQAPTPANAGRMRETRSEARSGDPAPSPEPAVAPDAVAPEPAAHARGESDALWLALKDKDAQIEALKARLAQAEAERQELAGRLAHLETSDAAEAEPGSVTMDSSEPGERTWGETPAEFAAELAALPQSGPATTEPGTSWPGPSTEPMAADGPPAEVVAAPETDGFEAAAAAEEAADAEAAAADGPRAATGPPMETPVESPAAVLEDTQPIEVAPDDPQAAAETDEDAGAGETAAADDERPTEDEPPVEDQPAPPAEAAAAAASLTLLQRGVDLLNVSRVPRKIAETNEQLGLPHVHAALEDDTVTVTFMWTMGWYRFRIDLDSGDVGMDDRGYDELELRPNAGVRADGTVQLSPARISRAGSQRVQAELEHDPTEPKPVETKPVTGPATPHEVAQNPPEFLSKSLLGQRSDDEAASWEQTKARDFDWDR